MNMRTQLWAVSNFVVITVIVVGTSACSLKSKQVAEDAVTQLHNQYNAGQYREIYSQADEEFRKTVKEADFVNMLEHVHSKLGTVKQSNQDAWNVNATTSGTAVTLGYDVEFSEGKGTEECSFRVSGDQAKLIGYTVKSPLLATK